jgi:hypothetical protein
MKFDEWKITKEQIIDAIKIARKNERYPDLHPGCDECFIRYLAVDIQNKAHIICLGTCQRTKKMLNSQYHTKYDTEEPVCSGKAVSYLPLVHAILRRTIRI